MDQNEVLKERSEATDMIDIAISESFNLEVATQNSTTDELSASNNKPTSAGRHFIIDFWGDLYLQDQDVIKQALKDAAKAAGAMLLHIHLHKFADQGGITGVALLAESHISVHTWPENNYAAFDVFMCGDAQPEKAIELLKQVFQPSKVEIKEILRGKP
jgi:S-adenosylmethionine decarboxylase